MAQKEMPEKTGELLDGATDLKLYKRKRSEQRNPEENPGMRTFRSSYV